MRVADVIGDAVRLRAAQERAQVVAVLGEPADDEVVVRQSILRTHVADHLAGQHGAIGANHREPPTGEAASAGPGLVGRAHDREHRTVEQREQARQAGRAAVCSGDVGAQSRVRRVIRPLDCRIGRCAAQPGDFKLVQRESPQAGENRRDILRVRRGRRDAGVHPQLRQPLAGLAQQAQRLLDLHEEAGHAAQTVVRGAHPVDRNSHHDAPERRNAGDTRQQNPDFFRVGAIRGDAERAHAGPVIGRDDLGEVVAQQGLPAGEGQVADRSGARRDAADAREVELGVASDRVPLRHVETVAAQRVAAMRQELDQVARRTARHQAAEVGEHDREIDGRAVHAAPRNVPHRQQAAGDDGGAGGGVECKPRQHEAEAVPARKLPRQGARLPACHTQQQQGGDQQAGEHDAAWREEQPEDQRPAPYPFACPAHHWIEAAVAANELQVVARAGHEFAHVIEAARLPVFDTQLTRQPQLVTGQCQPASQVGIFERDTAILTEAAKLEEHGAADRTHGAAKAARRAAIETSATHHGLARVEVTREARAARVLVVVAAGECVVPRMTDAQLHAAPQEFAIADARVGVEEHQPLAMCRARAGVARRPRSGTALVAQHAQPRAACKQLRRPVGRSVVDDDDFAAVYAAEPLSLERIEQSVDEGRSVVRGDDYGNLHALDVCMKRFWIRGAWACILRAPADASLPKRTIAVRPSQPFPGNEFP
ncbi:hypothetical protein AzCIB_0300 [Azoarcus sp. CIB]|nr:hypothetical protein AzCIB_0300 [Azoarcus sp. CIB]